MDTWAIIYLSASGIMLAYLLFRLIRYLLQNRREIKEKMTSPSKWAKSVQYSVGYAAACALVIIPAIVAVFKNKSAGGELMAASVISVLFGIIAISGLYASCECDAKKEREELAQKLYRAESELEIARRDLEYWKAKK